MEVVVFAKVQGLVKSESPLTLRICISEDLCKNYYSHLYFSVVTFMTKIQSWCYKTNKKLVKTQLSKNWMVKTTNVERIWMRKTNKSKNFDKPCKGGR